MSTLSDQELDDLILRFAAGRHPKVAAALRELKELRRQEDPNGAGAVQIAFDSLTAAGVAKLRSAMRSGAAITIDLHAIGLSSKEDWRLMRVIEAHPRITTGGKPGVVFVLHQIAPGPA